MKNTIKVRLTVFSFIIFFSSCASVGSKLTKYGSTVEISENQASASIKFKSHKVLYKELEENEKIQLWTKEKMESQVLLLPKGGYIIVEVRGLTIGSANTKWWEYIVQTMDGEEILRKQGEDEIPEFTSSQYGTTWWNLELLYLKDEITEPFKVFVIDKLNNKRSAFVVYPNQVNK